MKLTGNRNVFAFVGLLALYCVMECPLFGQCGEKKTTAQPASSCCSSGSGSVAQTPDIARPGTITAGDGTELANYWAALGADAALWYQHVQTLSSPAFGGREPGTRGIERAADYIEFHFREHGLAAPFVESGVASYRQPVRFEIRSGHETATQGSLSFDGADFTAGKDFVMTSFAGEGVASGPLAFAGYAIAEGPGGYSSFDKETDLSGRIAIVFRLEPLKEDGSFRWGADPGPYSSMTTKLAAVAARGASGVLIVNPPGARYMLPELDTFASAGCCSDSPSLPTAMITLERANQLFRRAYPASGDLRTWRGPADRGEVRAVNLGTDVKVTLTSRVRPQSVKTDNVAGALPGKGSLKNEWLIIGGHYDHIGRGVGSRADGSDNGVLLGADDNASGTAAVLQLASRLSSAYAKAPADSNLRSILFVAFTGEERGLIGSRNFLQYAPMPIGAIYAMLNFDAIGRMRDDRLWLYGYGTAKEFDELVGPILAESGLRVVTEPGSHLSDQVAFQELDIPVLFANTGGHAEYHTSRDVASTINPRGGARIVELSEKIARRLADFPGKLTYQLQPMPSRSCCGGYQAGKETPPASRTGS